ncbi:SDR family NAD(P)-dependent oxidoreductase [Streptomyces libani]
MSRTYLITGAASGIGKATATRLKEQGHTVIGADLKDADIVADLATPDGRAHLVQRAGELSGGRLDAVIAGAGLAGFEPRAVSVNYFGAVATLEGLRPLLAAGTDPRAVVIASVASVHPHDTAIADAALAGDEEAALAAAQAAVDRGEGYAIYGSNQGRHRPMDTPYRRDRRLGGRRYSPQRHRPRNRRHPHDGTHAGQPRHAQDR